MTWACSSTGTVPTKVIFGYYTNILIEVSTPLALEYLVSVKLLPMGGAQGSIIGCSLWASNPRTCVRQFHVISLVHKRTRSHRRVKRWARCRCQ